MRVIAKLTVASFKMFFRQREAILWTLLFPLLIVVLFGFVRFNGLGSIALGIVNDAGPAGAELIARIRAVRTFDVTEGTREAERAELAKGERDLVLVIPAGYAGASGATLTALGDVEAKPQATQLGALVLQRVLDEAALAAVPDAHRTVVATVPFKTRNLTYVDFLLPGVLAMSIMQAGIFGVAFGFVTLKKRGILRRLWVTPIRPSDFVSAQVAMRLVVLILQMTIMIAVGILFLHLHFIGNIAVIYLLGTLGAIAFLGFGFALAGISKSEDQVAPLANIITLPMLALSGVFFSRTNLPGFVRAVTSIFPLTYLADGLRGVAIDGATLLQVLPQIAGLAVWAVVACAVAFRLFRWE
ncbi:MAG TPA: ABC transporter permease [Bacteroidota bacterium]|nr:ABC transporter permease [Bacteroidota bacterium]